MGLTDDLSDQFFQDLVDVCGRLECDALDMLGVMMNESGVKANARNAHSNASGLIQFLPSTLVSLGWTDTPEAFRTLRAEEQLPWVGSYFQPYVRYTLSSAARVYQCVFLPSSLKLGSSSSTVIAQRNGINSAAYNSNRGLDFNFDSRITVGELEQAIERHYNSARWQEIAARLDNIQGGGTSQNEPPAFDLRTQQGIAGALDALGYDQNLYTYSQAVRSFQRRAGLVADGLVGPRTRAALAAALDDNGIPYVS